jgi:peroxiredoxin family protein
MDGKQKSWNNIVNSQSYKSWAGFAFENICHMHSEHIKKILGISGVDTETHYWNFVPKSKDKKGVQIDMMIEHTNGSRNIDIIECKYYNQLFTITKAYKEELVRKIETFNEQSKYRYNLRLIFITSLGMVKNEHYNEIVSLDICLGDIIKVKLSD